MTLMEVLVLLLIAAVCGSIGQAIAGFDLGGCLVSIVVGFIGAYIGMWLSGKLGWPELLAIKVGYPAGQSVLVVRAGDKRTIRAIVPVGGVGGVAGGQDRAPVFDAHANDFALEVRSQTQLIGDGAGEHVVGRLLPGRGRTTHRLH